MLIFSRLLTCPLLFHLNHFLTPEQVRGFLISPRRWLQKKLTCEDGDVYFASKNTSSVKERDNEIFKLASDNYPKYHLIFPLAYLHFRKHLNNNLIQLQVINLFQQMYNIIQNIIPDGVDIISYQSYNSWTCLYSQRYINGTN